MVKQSVTAKHTHGGVQTTWGARLRDIILGGQDGLVNVLGVVLVVAGATADIRIILISGIAATFAESISMGAVAYTSSRAATDYIKRVLQKERREIEKNPGGQADLAAGPSPARRLLGLGPGPGLTGPPGLARGMRAAALGPEARERRRTGPAGSVRPLASARAPSRCALELRRGARVGPRWDDVRSRLLRSGHSRESGKWQEARTRHAETVARIEQEIFSVPWTNGRGETARLGT